MSIKKWFLDAGLTDSTPTSEKTKVYLLNRLILISLIVNLSIFCIDMILGVYINGFANLVFVIIYYPLFLLHHRGKYTLVRNIFMIAVVTFITSMSITSFFQSRWTETENILFAAFPAVIYLYEKKTQKIFLLLVIVLLYGLKYYKTQLFSIPYDTNLVLTYVNTSITVAVMIAFSISFRREFTLALENTISLNEDLSHQKSELIIKEKKLTETIRTKNKLFSIVAHDLKNPLNLLNGLAHLSKDKNMSRQDLDQYGQMVEKNLVKINLMMDNVLVWAKSQLHEYTVNKDECHLLRIIEEVIKFYQDPITSKQLIIKLDVDDKQSALFDQNLLEIIVRNIFNNAVKYTPLKGQIEISSNITSDMITLAIHDSGSGMDSETIDRIQNGDFAESKHGTDGEGGTGLGLALSIQMLHINDGALSISSEPGMGTRVEITMPAYLAANSPGA